MVVVVLEVEPLRLFGMTCAVRVDSANFVEKKNAELFTPFLGVLTACLSVSKEVLSSSLVPLGSPTCNVAISECCNDVYNDLTIVFHDIANIVTWRSPAWLLVVFERSSFGQ